MKYEVEQKFRVDDLPKLERLLVELGAVEQSPLDQADEYFAHPARDFAQTDEALRIRRVGDDNFVTYKGPKLDAATKTRHEIELPLESGDAGAAGFADLLLMLSFHPVATVRKRRRPLEMRWNGQDLEIAIDDVAGLGTFVEIELIADAVTMDAAKATVKSLADRLGLVQSERRSYLELLLEKLHP